MPDTFAATLFAFVVFSFVVAFIKGRIRDKCLNEFDGDLTTLILAEGKQIWGSLCVEKTGFELLYRDAHADDDGHIETSYILYKSEFTLVRALARFCDELDENSRQRREKSLARTYHPPAPRRWLRKLNNVFKTVNDSILDLITVLIGQVKKTTSYSQLISEQEKYTGNLRKELVQNWGNSYEPLLERHIGRRVVLEINYGDAHFEYAGILKDYTAEFIEVMDVDYRTPEMQKARRADLVVPRKFGIVRHLGEKIIRTST